MREEEVHYFIVVFYPDRINWLKIDKIVDPFHIDQDVRILERKTLGWGEYGEFVRKLTIKLAKEKHRMIDKNDIMLAIFS